jgi:predicted nucleotidyltransferase
LVILTLRAQFTTYRFRVGNGDRRQKEATLGHPVDLVEEGRLKPRVQKSVEQDVVLAF